jgi:hypothetical protein
VYLSASLLRASKQFAITSIDPVEPGGLDWRGSVLSSKTEIGPSPGSSRQKVRGVVTGGLGVFVYRSCGEWMEDLGESRELCYRRRGRVNCFWDTDRIVIF